MQDYWSWNNAVDGSGTTIDSDTGSAGDLVASNLRDPRVGKPWRAGAMPVVLTIDLAASSGVSIIGLFGVNISDMTSLDVDIYDGDTLVWSWDIEITNDRQAVLIITDSLDRIDPINATKILVTGVGTVPLEIGRVWVGVADWEPSVGHSIDSSRLIHDLSNITRNPRGGGRIADGGSRLRSFTAIYNAMDQTEMDQTLYTLEVERGLAAQMLFIPLPEVYGLTRGPILGGLTENSETTFVGFLRASHSLTILEDG
jgi:hypothetical protein